jgi:hypothetical protein
MKLIKWSDIYIYIYRAALCSVVLTKYSDDQIKKFKMGRVCSMYENEERCIENFGGET